MIGTPELIARLKSAAEYAQRRGERDAITMVITLEIRISGIRIECSALQDDQIHKDELWVAWPSVTNTVKPILHQSIDQIAAITTAKFKKQEAG